jgi:hypothetical protein
VTTPAKLSDASGLFTDPAAAALRTSSLPQIWREHLLAQSMIDNGLYDEGYLVTIAPALTALAESTVIRSPSVSNAIPQDQFIPHPSSWRKSSEFPVLVVDRLDAGSVRQLAAKEVEPPAAS